MKIYIVYEGVYFDIEWYYDERGKMPAQEYFEQLPITEKKKIFYLFKSIADMGKIFNTEKFRHEGEQIYAFKVDIHRFLAFFYKESKIIITGAFEKKTKKLPKNAKNKALITRKNYLMRVQQGIYYE